MKSQAIWLLNQCRKLGDSRESEKFPSLSYIIIIPKYNFDSGKSWDFMEACVETHIWSSKYMLALAANFGIISQMN